MKFFQLLLPQSRISWIVIVCRCVSVHSSIVLFFFLFVFNWVSVGLPSTTSLTRAHSLSLSLLQLSLLFHFQLPPPSLFPFGLPLRFIARGRQTAEKPPCMERSVISTLSAKHTAFHIVLQGLGQIAIFMGHDKGNATLCSHFLLPNVRARHAVIHYIGNQFVQCVTCVRVCCWVAWLKTEKTNMNIVVGLPSIRQFYRGLIQQILESCQS